MEFLVMPKFTDSLIECYSADDSCTCYTCRGVRGCTGLACFTDCPLHIGVTANNPTK